MSGRGGGRREGRADGEPDARGAVGGAPPRCRRKRSVAGHGVFPWCCRGLSMPEA
ncbi:MAG: hypothetical protein JST59_30250 [Actinobacteria bacterium]|nr:hypothetical protein [Actinomycetota bacterium]